VASHLASGKASSQKKSRVSWSSLSRLPPTFWRYLYSVLSSGKTRRDDQADLLSTQYLAHQKYLTHQKYLAHQKIFGPKKNICPTKSIWSTHQKVFGSPKYSHRKYISWAPGIIKLGAWGPTDLFSIATRKPLLNTCDIHHLTA